MAVDPQSRNKILEGIVELNKNGATIVYTSHYMEEVEQISSRIAIMDKGQNVAIGTKEELKKMIKNTETITVEVPEIEEEKLVRFQELEHAYEVLLEDGRLRIRFSGGRQNLIHVLELLHGDAIQFGRVFTELPTLNDVFLEITGKELRDQ